MFGSQMLEVAIGVIFVFILVSVICTAVREVIEGFLKTRSAYLDEGIRELLHDRGDGSLTRALYEHPLIYSLFAGSYEPAHRKKHYSWLARGGNLPSYIPSRNFALALMDTAARGRSTDEMYPQAAGQLTAESIRANIRRIGNPAVERALITALDDAGGNLDRARANVEAWFDSSMDRIAGHYKRASQKIVLMLGILIAIVLNIDALHIADHLYRNEAARAAMAARAEIMSTRTEAAFTAADTVILGGAKSALTTLDSLPLPIGWSNVVLKPATVAPKFNRGNEEWRQYWLAKMMSLGEFVRMSLFGWAITGFAATLGAPFWFDVLNKVMVIRSTVKPNEKSPPEASEDRQIGKAAVTPTAASATSGAGAVSAVGTDPGTATGGAETPSEEAPPVPDEPDDVDGTRIDPDVATPDDELPPARGGVA